MLGWPEPRVSPDELYRPILQRDSIPFMKNHLLQGYRIINTWMGDPAKVILLDATLKVIREQNLLENAKVVGKQLLDGLVSLEVGTGDINVLLKVGVGIYHYG